MEVANRFAFNCEDEIAIRIYEMAYENSPKPRYTDMLACIACLNRKIGKKEAAIDAYKRELVLLKDEWNITKGEVVDSLKANIKSLEC